MKTERVKQKTLKPRCLNCGDETTFTSTVDMERDHRDAAEACMTCGKRPRILGLVVLAVAIYLGIASWVFALRHPWMTSTERFLWTGRMLAFGSVTVEEVRG